MAVTTHYIKILERALKCVQKQSIMCYEKLRHVHIKYDSGAGVAYTMGEDIAVGPMFFDEDRYTDQNRAFILIHELEHIHLRHPRRGGAMHRHLGQMWNYKRWCVAVDYIVNSRCASWLPPKWVPEDACIPEKKSIDTNVSWEISRNRCLQLTAEEVYAWLEANNDPTPNNEPEEHHTEGGSGEEQGQDQGDGQGQGDGSGNGEPEKGESQAGGSQEGSGDGTSQTSQAVTGPPKPEDGETLQQAKGEDGGGKKTTVGERGTDTFGDGDGVGDDKYAQIPDVDATGDGTPALRGAFIQQYVGNKARGRLSACRLNRRMLPHRVYLPGRKRTEPERVCVLFDVSMSMNPRDLDDCVSNIAKLYEWFPRLKVDVALWAGGHVKFKNGLDVMDGRMFLNARRNGLKIPCNGSSTRPAAGLQQVLERNISTARTFIILTDVQFHEYNFAQIQGLEQKYGVKAIICGTSNTRWGYVERFRSEGHNVVL